MRMFKTLNGNAAQDQEDFRNFSKLDTDRLQLLEMFFGRFKFLLLLPSFYNGCGWTREVRFSSIRKLWPFLHASVWNTGRISDSEKDSSCKYECIQERTNLGDSIWPQSLFISYSKANFWKRYDLVVKSIFLQII